MLIIYSSGPPGNRQIGGNWRDRGALLLSPLLGGTVGRKGGWRGGARTGGGAAFRGTNAAGRHRLAGAALPSGLRAPRLRGPVCRGSRRQPLPTAAQPD